MAPRLYAPSGPATLPANVVGRAHARQLDAQQRLEWQTTPEKDRTASLDAPWWLWTSIVDLVGIHEKAYLDHCRRFALPEASDGPTLRLN